MKTYHKTFLTILLLIGVTSAALAYMEINDPATRKEPPHPGSAPTAILSIDATLAQRKVLQGGDGNISVALTLTGADILQQENKAIQPVDLVVVLDRSGSMGGQKIDYARKAIIQLIKRMGSRDRIAIITYSNHVEMLSPLVKLDRAQRERVIALVRRIVAGGGTNLGGGLQRGINTLMHTGPSTRQRKVILISDGLANQGITSPQALGSMAANATERNLGVSTVGVGYDFNEVLMTTIADHGSGNYYFLDNPRSFAEVFKKEVETTRNVIAGSVELRIPLEDGVQLLDAGGYPIQMAGNVAIIRPGDLLAGQQRKIFLSYRIPTEHLQSYSLGDMQVRYQHNGTLHQVSNAEHLKVACVLDKNAVIASIDKDTWSEQVVKEDYSKLKDTVAKAIRTGKKTEALSAIEEYKARTNEMNSSVDSPTVTRNLEEEVVNLQQSVQDTFAGAPAAVAAKRKQQAKELQFESYRIRRDKQ